MKDLNNRIERRTRRVVTSLYFGVDLNNRIESAPSRFSEAKLNHGLPDLNNRIESLVPYQRLSHVVLSSARGSKQ